MKKPRIAVRLGGDIGAAMDAGIDEGAHDIVLAAHDQDRHADRLDRLVVAGIGHFGAGRQHQRETLEDAVDFRFETRRVVEVRRWNAQDFVGLRNGPRLAMRDGRLDHRCQLGFVDEPCHSRLPFVRHYAASSWRLAKYPVYDGMAGPGSRCSRTRGPPLSLQMQLGSVGADSQKKQIGLFLKSEDGI